VAAWKAALRIEPDDRPGEDSGQSACRRPLEAEKALPQEHSYFLRKAAYRLPRFRIEDDWPRIRTVSNVRHCHVASTILVASGTGYETPNSSEIVPPVDDEVLQPD
jgi:hypothetical protein